MPISQFPLFLSIEKLQQYFQMNSSPKSFFTTSITKEQSKDSGMAVVLILLIVGFLKKDDIFFWAAAVSLLMDMTFPMFFYPFAIFWFGLGNLLGAIVSRILLSVVYVVIVLPVALIRQFMGRDALLLKKFKKGNGSVMKTRNHAFGPADLEKPF
jgi:hypothetical protein